MIRLLATSRTFRLDHRPTPQDEQKDPENRLLSRFSVRRLEAEAIRDGMLALGGRLDPALEGPPVDGASHRRSVYLRVLRNNLDPFLSAFDFPVPSTCRGQRDATNVPAQSLGLLNDPLVGRWAGDWAQKLLKDARWSDPDQRLQRLFQEAYGRPPAGKELVLAKEHLAQAGDPAAAWRSLALTLLNTKEFIHVR